MKTLTAFYDLSVGPTSYDFVVFAIQAEMARRREGMDRLHFVFVPDEKNYIRPKPAIYDAAEAVWRLHQICLPACALFGASYTLAIDWKHAELIGQNCWPKDWDLQSLKRRQHLIGGVIDAAKAGEQVPSLHASAFARRKVRAYYTMRYAHPVVTMTMRRTYLPDRNSSPDDWTKVAQHIIKKGYGVHHLNDTAFALETGSGYGELNLDLRAACYEEAVLNLQANNGAASLCWFGDQPYRMFGAGDEHWDGLFVKQGLPLGESWSWAKPQQKLCYGKETVDSMVAEFEEWHGAR